MASNDDGRCYNEREHVSPSKDRNTSNIGKSEDGHTGGPTSDPAECLARLHEVLQEPIPEKPTAKYIANTAQTLVDTLNEKRKNDNILLDHFKEALDAQTQKILEQVQSKLYETYEIQSTLVDQKLQDLFACLERVNTTDRDLQNFRDQLKVLFHEIHMTN